MAVTGEGAMPGGEVAIRLCRADAEGPRACGRHRRRVITLPVPEIGAAEGSPGVGFRARFGVGRWMTLPDGRRVDCAPRRCEVVVHDTRDGMTRARRVPIEFER